MTCRLKQLIKYNAAETIATAATNMRALSSMCEYYVITMTTFLFHN